ncbi:MAG: 1-acyl-sn-glycerol-3-phosphate acyltransferase [Cyanobacteria bacterium RYN_339]|nr:1-acyl-sn-glycerol-3-phosphate acyltransferase [Cyanobacteria bacterium RYN_339]
MQRLRVPFGSEVGRVDALDWVRTKHMRSLLSIFVWLIWLVHIFVLGPLVVLVVVVSPRRLGFQMLTAAVRSAFFFAGIRVTAPGWERIDWSVPHVFMGNHQTMLDPFAMVVAIRRHVVVVEKAELQRMPVYGWLSRAWGNIPIQREDPTQAREGISLASERLKEGISIGIMPEGTRSKDGTIGPFKKGGFHMAIDAGADIVPFTFNGSFERLRRGDWRIYPGTIEIVFGEAIPTAGLGKDDLDDLMARVRGAVLASYKGPQDTADSRETART